jgi:glycosyltransferase involved in cell wall biosynthesis
LPNGVNIDFYKPSAFTQIDFRTKNGFAPTDLLFFYGGILGHAQGLEVILKAANELSAYPHVHFVLQGSGPEKPQLESLKAKLKLTNVHFLEPVPKAEMPAILQSIDVALVPLKNLPLFQGAIPSKVFEALAMEVPLLLGVDGEARQHFIENAEAGWYFEPENASQLAGQNGRKYVAEHFNRDQIAASLYTHLTTLS